MSRREVSASSSKKITAFYFIFFRENLIVYYGELLIQEKGIEMIESIIQAVSTALIVANVMMGGSQVESIEPIEVPKGYEWLIEEKEIDLADFYEIMDGLNKQEQTYEYLKDGTPRLFDEPLIRL